MDDFASAYLEDVLIYSDLEEEHVGHIKWIMQWLLNIGLYFKPEKCEFNKETVRNLGLIISRKGISMDKEKVETRRNWSRDKNTQTRRLNNLIDIQRLLRLCNYYRWFIPKFLEKAKSLTRLNKKNEPFVQDSEEQLGFETMVTTCTRAQDCRHFNHEREANI